jgi:hypothetical protein
LFAQKTEYSNRISVAEILVPNTIAPVLNLLGDHGRDGCCQPPPAQIRT